ncbi:TIGR03767 family metallophosphoesterase [Nakamurella endophytica]|uniref:Metallophosphoesterase n=1 Tax=Nakamurella endophytica TaxID=1748367 RepID=A0A917T949_9ACTN|nr:TIGR03767 family metallophosphoesterase [Nakamurella endophytica]GGM14415.1 metallophosphoesterase [Nakamurella endophytica]
MTTTDRSEIVGGAPGPQGYWPLAAGPGRPHAHRTDLHPAPDVPGTPVCTIAHLSDLHVCDAQSPARAEFLDRWADPDSPLKHLIDAIGSYRAQEMLTVQVADAMIRAVNQVESGPVGGRPVDWAVVTGDVTDNAQTNELEWYIGLLDGGRVLPDSGTPARYEGVADHDHWDEYFWHPEPGESVQSADPQTREAVDRPRRLHGFPDAPGLLDACRRPVVASGLSMPWLAVHGNHDQMIQGTIPATEDWPRAGLERLKAIGLPPSWSLEEVARFCQQIDANAPDALDRWPELVVRAVTPDLGRTTITRTQFLAAHQHPGARPPGHGFGTVGPGSGRAWYRFDHLDLDVPVTSLVLDTVNHYGGWQGCLDPVQLAWLDVELAAADREGRYVVLASHHTLADLVNGTAPEGAAPRVLADEVAAVVDAHPSVVAWLNGHRHVTAVVPHTGEPGGHPWWEVTAPSLIDHPQQARIVELLRGAGTLTVAVTMVDHCGELPWSGTVTTVDAMAGLSRQLAANAWQARVSDLDGHPRAGAPDSRNVLLHLPDPFL